MKGQTIITREIRISHGERCTACDEMLIREDLRNEEKYSRQRGGKGKGLEAGPDC